MKKISKEEHNEILLYLDDLRDSGITNMLGAGKYIENNLVMTKPPQENC